MRPPFLARLLGNGLLPAHLAGYTGGMISLRVLFLLVLLSVSLAEPLRAQAPVDLALVLAVDASSSVNAYEFDLQMNGIADAFRDPEVQGAISGVGDRGMAVALVQWGSQNEQVVAVDWSLVYDPATAAAFAAAVQAAPRYVDGGSTAIGNALRFSTRFLASAPYQSMRQVIDVSGDGRINQGIATQTGRDAAVAAGVTVNGLAILNEEPGLDLYYRDNVVGGPGAFVLSAVNYEDFGRAMRLKLVREMAGPPIAQQAPEGEGLLLAWQNCRLNAPAGADCAPEPAGRAQTSPR
ncbi:DUF1194 domain-containing protein [Aquibaculum arenosum]|uniref:DUF1194 domain-containing protein n=1 Tax=Aquibaculum arenosum TaxID=3032591 RepID=A0ABT5YJL3_9PROT|nr:DUF1194 domain-containing protein [Fodinicurvata sp. CAU 1616]MDF2095093.1 DUF1194 domain-containing protein [Fodinicurvata sp. CAU 1616]